MITYRSIFGAIADACIPFLLCCIVLALIRVARSIDRIAAAQRAEVINRVRAYALANDRVTFAGVVRVIEDK